MAEFDDLDRARTAWWAAAALLGAALAYTLYSFTGTFVFGVFIYYATRPVYRRLKRWVRPPTVAAMVALLTLALPAILLVAYMTAIGLQELDAFLKAREASLGQLETLLAPYIDASGAVQDPQSLLDEPSVRAALQTVGDNVLNYIGFVGNAGVHLFAMITIAFYLLRDDHRLATWFRRRFADGDGVLDAYASAVDRDLSKVFFGNILNAFLSGIIAAVSYNALNAVAPAGITIPYPTLLGLLTGVASLIPIVGIKLVYIPLGGWLAFLAVDGGSGYAFVALYFVVAFVIVDVIPDLVLRPYVSGRDLHLGLVMLAYIFGPLLWGWYGIFLGPMVLVFVVHFVRLVLPELVAGERIEPEARGQDLWTGPPPGAAVDDDAPDDPAGTDAADGGTSAGRPSADQDPGDQSTSDRGSPDEPSDDAGDDVAGRGESGDDVADHEEPDGENRT